MKLHKPGICAAVAALAVLLPAGAALADVKAGVDAWSAGNYDAAVREWREPARAGDADAQFNLAQAYRLGRGVPADDAQAETLYAQAAAQGHLRAADQYGLLLFQKGEREKAMPYVAGAAGRGDPRAQYLLGIAHFNGDLADKDWPRAYALLTLANSTGLPQAASALAQMDEYIPLEQRQQAQALAVSIRADTESRRARDLAAVDLALGATEDPAAPAPAPSPAPKPVQVHKAPVTVAALAAPAPAPAKPAAPKAPATKPAGEWKVQLGSFAVAGNADRMWRQLASRPEIAGREKLEKASGKLTVLYAAGYASRSEAASACASLKRSGQDCLVTR
ncbi:SPOR domain-containing protein [Qipengyuania gaetbuli]|uniref:SPOR domain-containing protein n=1 Tax=Qipengyuania gaetbuli TaxID=266952 RepID=UPI001CFE967E|nr:SPOR domain-containing protein [Qipengyuania gaetbuli]